MTMHLHEGGKFMDKRPVKTDVPAKKKTFLFIEIAIILVLTAAFAVLFIFTGFGFLRLGGLILTLGFLILFAVGADKKTSIVLGTIVTAAAICCLAFMSLIPCGITSHSPWRYKYQKAYINIYRNATDCFPDSIPKDVSDYYFHHTPSMLQGAGNTTLLFTASPDVIKAYEEKYAPKAISSVPLSDGEKYHLIPNGDFWDDTEATVYLLSNTGNFNHPHNSRMIISKDHTKIGFYRIV